MNVLIHFFFPPRVNTYGKYCRTKNYICFIKKKKKLLQLTLGENDHNLVSQF